jgi:Tfp pilus assembly protein PilF
MKGSSYAVFLLGALAVLPGTVHAQQARVFGNVTDEAGRPVEGVEVVLEPAPGSGAVPVRGLTKASGSYILGLVRPGQYDLAVHSGDSIPKKVRKLVRNEDNRVVEGPLEEAVAEGKPFRLDLKEGSRVELDIVIGPRQPRPEVSPGEPSGPEAALLRLGQKAKAGECREALGELEQVVASSPGLAKGHYLLGYCQAVQHDFERAADSLGRALELNPNFEGAHLLRGQVLQQLGRREEAEAELKAELSSTQDPTLQISGWSSLAILYRDTDRPEEAIAAFSKVTELAPDKAEAYAELAVLYTKVGQLDKAAGAFERARALGTGDPTVLLNVGIGYFNRKEYSQAAAVFEQVLAAGGPNDDLAMAHALLGKCQLREGKEAQAIASFEKSLELDPNGPLAKETREILKALKK